MSFTESLPLKEINKKSPKLATALATIQTPIVLGSRNEAEQTALNLIAGKWLVWMHWAIKKKYINKHKIPVAKRFWAEYEPKGEILYRELKICPKAYSELKSIYRKGLYCDPFALFAAIVSEERAREIECLFQSQASPTKTTSLNWMKYLIKSLEDCRNPYHPDTDIHRWIFIEATLSLERNSNSSFHKQYWEPYLKALKQWARHLDRNQKGYWGTMHLQEGEVIAKNKRHPKKFEGSNLNRSPKSRQGKDFKNRSAKSVSAIFRASI